MIARRWAWTGLAACLATVCLDGRIALIDKTGKVIVKTDAPFAEF